MNTFHPACALRSVLFALLVTSVPAVASAASAQEALAASLSETNTEIVRTGNKLQETIQTLNELTAQTTGDLRPTYQRFSTAVTETQELAKTTAARAATLTDNMTTYFVRWQNELGGISSPGVKSAAEKRLTTVQRSYSALAADMAKVAEKFRPLLGDMNDIKVALDLDLTAGGVKSIKGVANKATKKMASLHEDVTALLGKISDTRKLLGSSAEY